SRRLRIAHAIDALRELVPHNKEVGREAFVDIVIDHVKHLQNQMKELCQSRLSGESSSAPVTFIEGHGHYIVQEQMLIGPLEETLGEMFTVYPSAADSLLQSKGLVVMPMCFADGLCENNEILIKKKKITYNKLYVVVFRKEWSFFIWGICNNSIRLSVLEFFN
ncbi:hypothetical protein M569_00563, partial [Genlisea aurea]